MWNSRSYLLIADTFYFTGDNKTFIEDMCVEKTNAGKCLRNKNMLKKIYAEQREAKFFTTD